MPMGWPSPCAPFPAAERCAAARVKAERHALAQFPIVLTVWKPPPSVDASVM
jgi:hypothetical protein